MKLTNPNRIRPQLAPAEICYVHAVSRVVDRRFIMEEAEKGEFLSLVRRYEAFCCLRVVGYCLMSNHFHLLIEATGRPVERPGEAWLISHVEATLGTTIADQYRGRLELWRDLAKNSGVPIPEPGSPPAPPIVPEMPEQPSQLNPPIHVELTSEPPPIPYAHQQYDKVLADIWQRMYSVSAFIQSVKQQFTCWYNKRMERRGTLWEERFSSTLVQRGAALTEIAAYIDLNPVRAGIVADPKDYRWSQYGAAVAGEIAPREAVVFVAQAYASLIGEELADWSRAQGRYRILMYRRGLIKPTADGSVEGVFSDSEVQRVYEEMGSLPDAAGISGVSYVGKRIRYFTEGVAFGAKSFVEGIFSQNKTLFGKNRKTGARKLRGDGDWGEMRALRDLKKGIVSDSEDSDASA